MNVSTVTNHFSTANKGFITTLGSSILSGATTIPLTSVSGLTNGTIFVGIIEPGLSNEQEFTGTVDTAGVQITGVKWTDGTDVDHTAGVTIVDYVAATDWNMNTKGLLVSHDQDGTLKAGAVDVAGVLASNVVTYPKLESELQGGWNSTSALPAISTVVANGNRSYTLTHASSIASVVSPGMRRRFSRTSAAPITSFSLNGTNMYFNKTSPAGMTFTDDFVVSAWVKLESYGAGNTYIISRFNNTSGWGLLLNSSGQVIMVGFNGANTNYSQVVSYQSVPLNKWVHVAAQLDMSAFTATTTTSYVMIDGVDVPCSVVRGGTNPTALIQAGNLEVGSTNGGTLLFDGKLAQVAIYSAKVTQATIRASIDRGLTGSETSLISAYSGANTTDLASTGNNLTAQNGAVSGYADAPFGNGGISSTIEYGLTMSVSSDGLTEVVQVPEGCALPTTGGITASAYSSMANPFGWVSDKDRFVVKSNLRTVSATTSNATYGAFISGGYSLTVPIGSWTLGHKSGSFFNQNTSMAFNMHSSALTGLTVAQANAISPFTIQLLTSAAASMVSTGNVSSGVNLTTAQTYVMYSFGASTGAGIDGSSSQSEIYAIPAGL